MLTSRMKIFVVAVLAAGAAACASAPLSEPSAPAATVDTISANRYRVTVSATSGESDALLRDRAMLQAARTTLERGAEWFEIAGEISGSQSLSLVIVTGSGETLAGGANQIHDARQTVDRLSRRPGVS